jgi:hypothetical protein
MYMAPFKCTDDDEEEDDEDPDAVQIRNLLSGGAAGNLGN